MQLRDYQQASLQAIARAFTSGVWAQVLVLPTGGGKTVVFSHLAQALASSIGQLDFVRNRMLIIAHRDKLLEQAREKLIATNPDLVVEIEQGDRRATPMAEIVIASVQTLAAGNCARLARLGPDAFRITVVDECHHTPAESYQTVLRRMGLVAPTEYTENIGRGAEATHAARQRLAGWWRQANAGRLLLGVTATPSRSDALGLEWSYERVVYEETLPHMIERGYLVPPVGFAVDTGLSLDTVKTVGGDFQQKGLAAIVNTADRNAAIVKTWHERAAWRPTIAFAVDIQHAKDLAGWFTSAGARATWVAGDDDERHTKIAALESGGLDVVVNCQLLTEGVDIPRVSCVVLGRPTQSSVLYSQMIGRGLRLFEGKQDCIVIDGVDNCARHSLITIGDLFGLPKQFDLQGQDPLSVKARLDAIAAQFPQADLTGARSLDEVEKRVRAVDLFKAKPSRVVHEYASMKWIQDGATRFYLALMGSANTRGRIELRQGTLGEWRIVVKERGKDDQIISATDDVRTAFRVAERWLSMHRPSDARLNNKNADWRQRAPTEAQIAKLQQWGATRLPTTRGDASDMLTDYIQNRGWKT